jgi:uncharacterized protein YcbX
MPHSAQQIVGHIAGVFRYPVKSMAGETLEQANIRWTGVEGDRRYAFVLADGAKSAQIDFPWFTGREHPPLVSYKAAYQDGSSAVAVVTPDGSIMPIDSDQLHAELTTRSKRSISLLQLGRGAYDGSPVSLISTRTIAEVAAASGIGDTDPRRYRPNLLVELAGALHEDKWVGRMLTIGEGENAPKLWVTRPDQRCMMINLNPETGVQQPQVLKYVANARSNNLGIYATVLAPGIIKTGDTIRLSAL